MREMSRSECKTSVNRAAANCGATMDSFSLKYDTITHEQIKRRGGMTAPRNPLTAGVSAFFVLSERRI